MSVNEEPSYTRCHLWKCNQVLRSELDCLVKVKELFDLSHQIRSIRRCRDCGQLYLWDFDEQVDWNEGNDAQYWTVMPVENMEEAERLGSEREMMPVRAPYIRWRFTDQLYPPEWVRTEV